MDRIIIKELAVNFQVGVPASERARPQRLLLNIELFSDFTKCAASDDISQTINYFDVVQGVKSFGDKREWRLIEKLASDLAAMLLKNYRPAKVAVEVRKFIVPDCRYISVSVERP
jgi:dihydroneopterin aldolase